MKRFESIRAYFMKQFIMFCLITILFLTFFTVREYISNAGSLIDNANYKDTSIQELETRLSESEQDLSLFKQKLLEIQKELSQVDSFVTLNGHLGM